MYRQQGDAATGGEVIVASPSDLVGFLACPHKLTLDAEVVAGTRARPADDDPETEVLRRRGDEHEKAYLARLRAEGLAVADCDAPTVDGAPGAEAPVVDAPSPVERLRARVAATRQAIDSGTDVVFQATFLDERDPQLWWRGHADFLRRTHDAHPDTGRPAYEPEDTKLARHVKPGALLQLALYAELLEQVQGVAPRDVHVVLGGQTTETVPLRHVAAYERLARRRFATAVADPPATYPEPVEHCAVCRWRSTCDAQRRADDHLSLVAGLGREQSRKLAAAGITTVGALAGVAELPRDAWPVVDRLGDATYDKLVFQARLQVAASGVDGPPPYELLPIARSDADDGDALGSDRGLEALPEPDAGDLYFDIEGDPFVDGGLEYLFGVAWRDGDGFAFQPFWGHTRAEEKAAFEALVDLVVERRAAHPGMHVYHYAPYETTALKRLMGVHGTREAEVDQLLRGKVFVDLYQVVRHGLRVGVESYSIKKLEPLYMEARADAITDAASSIVEYERYLDERDPAAGQQILDDIEAYNRTDCESTGLLHAWLEERRVEAADTFGFEPARQVPPRAEVAAADDDAAEPGVAELLAALSERLLAGVDLDAAELGADDEARWLLSQLLHFHRREDKPAWWRYFERVAGYEPGSLDDDPDCLNGLVYEGVVGTVQRSEIHQYRFDPGQEHKITATRPVYDPATQRRKVETGERAPTVGTVVELDAVDGIVQLKRGKGSAVPHPHDLIPDEIVPSGPLKIAIQVVADSVADHGTDTAGPYRAVRDLLCRRPPRLRGVTPGERLRRAGEGTREAASRLIAELDDSYLPIQGPPGTGKTFTAAHAVVDLVEAGRRVGITANSHAVVTHLLDGVMACAVERGVPVRALQKADDGKGSTRADVDVVGNAEVEAALASGEVDVVAGTAWLFARDALDQALDVVVVDEAGQLSLANVVAAGRAARNLVLVGDPQQLAQPMTGSHPPGVGVSALDHVLGGDATIADHRGLFLDRTWRMHPDITRYISELAYEERLGAEASCAQQTIHGDGLVAGSGIRWVPVEHHGNRLSSTEEAEHIAALVDDVVGRHWTNGKGERREVALGDVLVVAPYNAQVHLLAQHLPRGARVGTVDRFQGQEGAVVIVSMTASSVEQVPRGMEFLYSTNRLNVAISRARALTVVVASPALLVAPVRTVDQLRLVNGLCRYAELALPVAIDRG